MGGSSCLDGYNNNGYSNYTSDTELELGLCRIKEYIPGDFRGSIKAFPKGEIKIGAIMGIDKQQGSYLPRAGLYLGIIGIVCLLFFVLIFQEDWMRRFSPMIALIPISLIALLILKRLPLVGGSLLVALGITALILDILFSAGHPGEIAGRGLGLTLVFVSIPLVASGVLFILSGRKRRKSTKRNSQTPG